MPDFFEPFDGVRDVLGQPVKRRPRGREPSRLPSSMVDCDGIIQEAKRKRRQLLESTGCCHGELDVEYRTWCFSSNCECAWKLIGVEVMTESKGELVYTPLGESNAITLKIDDVEQWIANPTKSGKLPSKRDVIMFCWECKARQYNPFSGDAVLVGYDTQNGPKFSCIPTYQALAKRAELNPAYRSIKWGLILQRKDKIERSDGEFYIPATDSILGGWSEVKRNDRDDPVRVEITFHSRAKPTQPWKDDPAGMICKCAKAKALREAFPNELGALPSESDNGHGDPIEIDGTDETAEVIATDTEELLDKDGLPV